MPIVDPQVKEGLRAIRDAQDTTDKQQGWNEARRLEARLLVISVIVVSCPTVSSLIYLFTAK